MILYMQFMAFIYTIYQYTISVHKRKSLYSDLSNLHCLRHQILPTNQAEDGDFVVLVENAERSQNLVQG